MASVVAARRAVQQALAGVSAANYNVGHAGFWGRGMSQLVKSNGKRAFLVDTLALVRTLESQGVPSKQAEAITAAITEVLNDSLENVAQSYVSKGEMQKSQMIQEANLSKFKSEVKSSQQSNEKPEEGINFEAYNGIFNALEPVRDKVAAVMPLKLTEHKNCT